MRGLAGLSLGDPPPRRRLNLTPMIDVVFLLVVFFMLASRFTVEGATPVAGAAAGAAERWDGPPRLIDLGPEGVRLNGVAIAPEGLAAALAPPDVGARRSGAPAPGRGGWRAGRARPHRGARRGRHRPRAPGGALRFDAPPARSGGAGLLPMINVVFLLLVFLL
ncbi:MAG: hypothetical protein RL123_1849, partial [Pseudomonadota bacterium]